MIRRGHGPAAGEWSIPGGRVEFGETMVEALVREVLEETSIEIVVDDFLGCVESIDNEFHFVFLDFAATASTPNRSGRRRRRGGAGSSWPT